MNARIDNVLTKMNQDNINQLLVSDEYSIYYLTGKLVGTGHRMMVLVLDVNNKHKLFVHEMFNVGSVDGIEVNYFKDTDNYIEKLYNSLDSKKQVAVDKFMDARYLIGLQDLGFDLPVKNGSYIVDDIRAVKTDEEIKLMREASLINDKVMLEIQDYIANAPKPITEQQCVDELTRLYAQYTDEGISFDPIIAFGKNGADPHSETSNTKLQEGDGIVIDIGCIKDGYCSDMTRTVFYKECSDFKKEIFEIVKEANIRATAAIKPGMKCSEIDKVARDYITSKGYGEYFTHRLGHFIGMEVHEAGDISAANDNVVSEGMIFSIEPGIYLYDKEVGVRIENLVVVTKDGAKSLNDIPLDFKII
ncbi:MAG: aminopeptidase P family protein [Erysipelotrichales bacterium]